MIGNRDSVLVQYGVGSLDWAPSPRPDENTLWDMASLTKVVGLTTALMQLSQAGKVDLDAPVQRYIKEFQGPNKERVTLRHLLTHSSGMPAWRPLYKETDSPDAARALAVGTEAARHAPHRLRDNGDGDELETMQQSGSDRPGQRPGAVGE